MKPRQPWWKMASAYFPQWSHLSSTLTASTAALFPSSPHASICAPSFPWSAALSDRPGSSLAEMDAIAVTEGPGLVGSLLVGITYAKALCFAAKLPLIGVNHVEGHIHAVVMEARQSGAPVEFPALALVASGGHTHLFEVAGRLPLSAARQDSRRCRRGSFRQSGEAARLRISGRPGAR